MTASSSGWTPLFLNEAPQTTGVIALAMQALRRAALISSIDSSSSSRKLHHQLVVLLGSGLDELVTVHLGVVSELGGNLADGRVDALVVLVEEDGVHREQVDDADERVLGADRQLKRHGARVEPVLHHLHDVVEVRTRCGPSC